MLRKPDGRHVRGFLAELFAVFFLRLKGYSILERNARTSLGEVDILAKRGSDVCVVEVKFRRTQEAARMAISYAQRQRLGRRARQILRRYSGCCVRCDAVLVFPAWPFVEHVENAWVIEESF